jgi:hypothetical protein
MLNGWGSVIAIEAQETDEKLSELAESAINQKAEAAE